MTLLVGGVALSYSSMNGYQTMSYKSGTYEGNVSWGSPAGKGKLTYADGAVYTGDFSSGQRQGKGLYRSKNGDTYDGEWKNDKFDGQGKLALASACATKVRSRTANAAGPAFRFIPTAGSIPAPGPTTRPTGPAS